MDVRTSVCMVQEGEGVHACVYLRVCESVLSVAVPACTCARMHLCACLSAIVSEPTCSRMYVYMCSRTQAPATPSLQVSVTMRPLQLLPRGRIHEGPSRYRDHKANRPDSYGPLTCSEEAVFMKAGQQGPQLSDRVFLNHDLVTDCACVLKGMCTFSTR